MSCVACVARLATKAGVANGEGAAAALKKEWGKLREVYTWGRSKVMEPSQARRMMGGDAFHIGRLIATLVEKNAELPEGPEGRDIRTGSSTV
eukprot:4447364-Pyramimonas_sp.AAC.1